MDNEFLFENGKMETYYKKPVDMILLGSPKNILKTIKDNNKYKDLIGIEDGNLVLHTKEGNVTFNSDGKLCAEGVTDDKEYCIVLRLLGGELYNENGKADLYKIPMEKAKKMCPSLEEETSEEENEKDEEKNAKFLNELNSETATETMDIMDNFGAKKIATSPMNVRIGCRITGENVGKSVRQSWGEDYVPKEGDVYVYEDGLYGNFEKGYCIGREEFEMTHYNEIESMAIREVLENNPNATISEINEVLKEINEIENENDIQTGNQVANDNEIEQ